jgi:hypothetical protein
VLSRPDTAVELEILLPRTTGVIVDGVVAADGHELVLARAEAVPCPVCGAASVRDYGSVIEWAIASACAATASAFSCCPA